MGNETYEITTLQVEEIESKSAIFKCELTITIVDPLPEVELIWNE